MSRSSTPAPPERDDGTDDDDEETNAQAQSQGSALTKVRSIIVHLRVHASLFFILQVPTNESLSNSVDESYEPHLERADSVRLLNLKKPKSNNSDHESALSDANDDEVHQLTSGKGNETNGYDSTNSTKPDGQTKAMNQKHNFGLPTPGTFSDAHAGQQQQGGFVSSQSDFNQAEIFRPQTTNNAPNAFRPTGGSN